VSLVCENGHVKTLRVLLADGRFKEDPPGPGDEEGGERRLL